MNNDNTRERYDTYLVYRRGGRVGARQALTALRDSEAVIKDANGLPIPSSLQSGLMSVMLGIITYTVVLSVLEGLGIVGERGALWIVSLSGKTTKQLPLCLALRIIRERGWGFAEVEPVKKLRLVTKREALRVLLLGDRVLTTAPAGSRKDEE